MSVRLHCSPKHRNETIPSLTGPLVWSFSALQWLLLSLSWWVRWLTKGSIGADPGNWFLVLCGISCFSFQGKSRQCYSHIGDPMKNIHDLFLNWIFICDLHNFRFRPEKKEKYPRNYGRLTQHLRNQDVFISPATELTPLPSHVDFSMPQLRRNETLVLIMSIFHWSITFKWWKLPAISNYILYRLKWSPLAIILLSVSV